MTWRTWLGQVIRDLAAQPAPEVPLPTPNQESTPPSPTPNTRTSEPTSVDQSVSLQLVEMMGRMQAETMKEVRGMVMDILQGRERPPLSEEELASVSRTPFDPPDYDAPGTQDLSEGIAAVFSRQDQEDVEFRTSHSEPELLKSQLERARMAAGLDAQGPTPEPSFSTESLGLRWEDQTQP